jgi:hypothetical protein
MKLKALVWIIFLLELSALAAALENRSLSKEAIEVAASLNLSEKGLYELEKKGFGIIRYNDTLGIANQIYGAQVALEKSGGKTDFSLVYQRIDELNSIIKYSSLALDELNALKISINQTKGDDMSAVIESFEEAQEAFDSERYEEVQNLVDITYAKISEMEAFDAKLKAFSDAVSKSFIGFIKNNWKIISIIIIFLAAVSLLTYKKIIGFIIKSRINSLEIRRSSVENLIAKTQKDYFETGKLSETTYKTRTIKYAEIIRDINRQIPLLKEELEMRKLRSKIKNEVKKR